MENISVTVEQIETWAIFETQSVAKAFCLRIANFQIGKFYLAKIFCLEPMDHGRHVLAGRSPEFKELNQL
jgi:hypothetical protein